MSLVDGNWLNQYVAPQLLEEFRNYKDDFMGVIPGAPAGAIAADGLRMNKLINNAGFLVNNEDNFTPKKMSGKKGIIEWDKFDTEPTEVDDAEVRALPFDKRSEVRRKHSESYKIGVRDYCLQKLAPAADATGMPVMRTTGEDDGTGRLRLTYADLIKFYSIFPTLNLPNDKAWYFILNPHHSQDLILDRASTNNYRDGIVIDEKTGECKRFYKFNVFENNAAPIYAEAGTLKAQGAASAPGDQMASTFFYAPNTVFHLDSVKILYKPETTDTRNADPTSEFRLQAYGLCDKRQDYGFGALVSGVAEDEG